MRYSTQELLGKYPNIVVEIVLLFFGVRNRILDIVLKMFNAFTQTLDTCLKIQKNFFIDIYAYIYYVHFA